MIKKIPDVYGFVTTTIRNTKISKVKNVIPVVSDLVRKTNYDAKISVIKYFTIADYNNFMSDILDAKIKQKKLVNKSNAFNLVQNSDLNTKIATLATKSELKVEQDKIVKLEAFDSSYFHGRTFFGNDISQNMFVYQPKFDTLEIKKDKGTAYVIS